MKVYVLVRVDTDGPYSELVLAIYKTKEKAEEVLRELEARGDKDYNDVPYSYYIEEEEVIK